MKPPDIFIVKQPPPASVVDLLRAIKDWYGYLIGAALLCGGVSYLLLVGYLVIFDGGASFDLAGVLYVVVGFAISGVAVLELVLTLATYPLVRFALSRGHARVALLVNILGPVVLGIVVVGLLYGNLVVGLIFSLVYGLGVMLPVVRLWPLARRFDRTWLT